MKAILIVSIGLLALCAAQVAFVPLPPVNVLADNHSADTEPAITSSTNQDRKKLKLTLTTNEPTCAKSSPCTIVLGIQSLVGDEVVTEAALNLLLMPYAENGHRNSSQDLNSPLSLSTLKNLQPNEYGRVVVKANQLVQKEIDLEKVEWLKSIQSSWTYSGLWDRLAEGKYEVYAELIENPKVIDSINANKRIVEFGEDAKVVTRTPALSGRSNSIIIDFKK